jgi:hypothetical protein
MAHIQNQTQALELATQNMRLASPVCHVASTPSIIPDSPKIEAISVRILLHCTPQSSPDKLNVEILAVGRLPPAVQPAQSFRWWRSRVGAELDLQKADVRNRKLGMPRKMPLRGPLAFAQGRWA